MLPGPDFYLPDDHFGVRVVLPVDYNGEQVLDRFAGASSRRG